MGIITPLTLSLIEASPLALIMGKKNLNGYSDHLLSLLLGKGGNRIANSDCTEVSIPSP